MIDKLEKYKSALEEETYNHWMGVARFFRGFEYCRLVETFGDVPYYGNPLAMQIPMKCIKTARHATKSWNMCTMTLTLH